MRRAAVPRPVATHAHQQVRPFSLTMATKIYSGLNLGLTVEGHLLVHRGRRELFLHLPTRRLVTFPGDKKINKQQNIQQR